MLLSITYLGSTTVLFNYHHYINMTTGNNNDALNSDIGISLEHDPELMYWTWKVHTEDAAANLATIVETTGLLSEMLTDEEWDAYPANRSASPGGTVTVAARPAAPAHEVIVGGMTNAQISVAKYNNDRHKIWHEAVTVLKSNIVRSLGPTLESTIGPPPQGFRLQSLRQIVDAVRAKYGTVDQLALDKMEDVLATPLDHVSNLDKHLARLKQHILMQAAAGYAIEPYRQVKLFRRSVGSHHQIVQCLADYDRLYPDPLTATLAAITAHVVKHLPNVRAAAQIASTTTGRALTVSAVSEEAPKAMAAMSFTELQCAYSVMAYKLENQHKKRPKGAGKKKPLDKRQKGASGAVLPTECTHYCHAHGAQNSHSSSECKVMASQPQHFTAAMRSATSSNSPPGGSTLVRGRDP